MPARRCRDLLGGVRDGHGVGEGAHDVEVVLGVAEHGHLVAGESQGLAEDVGAHVLAPRGRRDVEQRHAVSGREERYLLRERLQAGAHLGHALDVLEHVDVRLDDRRVGKVRPALHGHAVGRVDLGLYGGVVAHDDAVRAWRLGAKHDVEHVARLFSQKVGHEGQGVVVQVLGVGELAVDEHDLAVGERRGPAAGLATVEGVKQPVHDAARHGGHVHAGRLRLLDRGKRVVGRAAQAKVDEGLVEVRECELDHLEAFRSCVSRVVCRLLCMMGVPALRSPPVRVTIVNSAFSMRVPRRRMIHSRERMRRP